MRQAETPYDRAIGRSPKDNAGVRKLPTALGLAWLLTAVGLMVLGGCQSLPSSLVTVHQSKYQNVDRTCDVLKAAIEAQGFSYKGTVNLNEAMAKHGVHLVRQVRVIQFGRAKYAHDMLAAQPEISAFMPCRFGVYEGDGGTVYVSGVNPALIAQIFGGVVGEVMGKNVTPDQAAILNTVALPLTHSRPTASEGVGGNVTDHAK